MARNLTWEMCMCAGTRSVAMVFRAVVFTFLPTAFELVLVCGLLARTFQPAVAGSVAAYVAWTAFMTKVCSVKQFSRCDVDALRPATLIQAGVMKYVHDQCRSPTVELIASRSTTTAHATAIGCHHNPQGGQRAR